MNAKPSRKKHPFAYRLSFCACGLLAAASLLLSSCSSMDGGFSLCGYHCGRQYSRDIKTIRVPIFKNKTFHRDIEFQLTQAVIKQIEEKTPWKVVQDGHADAELLGTVVGVSKRVIYQNPLNEVREADLTLGVEVLWMDLRSNKPLSGLPAQAGDPLDFPNPANPPGSPETPRPPDPLAPRIPGATILVQRSASFIPETGQSVASGRKQVVDDLAEQIVSMMEKSW